MAGLERSLAKRIQERIKRNTRSGRSGLDVTDLDPRDQHLQLLPHAHLLQDTRRPISLNDLCELLIDSMMKQGHDAAARHPDLPVAVLRRALAGIAPKYQLSKHAAVLDEAAFGALVLYGTRDHLRNWLCVGLRRACNGTLPLNEDQVREMVARVASSLPMSELLAPSECYAILEGVLILAGADISGVNAEGKTLRVAQKLREKAAQEESPAPENQVRQPVVPDGAVTQSPPRAHLGRADT